MTTVVINPVGCLFPGVRRTTPGRPSPHATDHLSTLNPAFRRAVSGFFCSDSQSQITRPFDCDCPSTRLPEALTATLASDCCSCEDSKQMNRGLCHCEVNAVPWQAIPNCRTLTSCNSEKPKLYGAPLCFNPLLFPPVADRLPTAA